MSQKKMAFMLKSVAIFIGVMGVLFLTVFMPIMACNYREKREELAYLFWPGLIYGWIIGIIGFMALYRFWLICKEIEKDNSFSEENIKSLNIISILGMIVASVWFVGFVVLIFIGTISVGVFVLIGIAVIASLTISIIAIALSHLVHKAYILKQENEFTI